MLNNILFKAYGLPNKKLKKLIFSTLLRLEDGEVHSPTIRKIYKHYHHINIGLYTHGGCFNLGNMHDHVTFGRYCSIARNVKILTRNHPTDRISSHGLFFNPNLGFCDTYSIETSPIEIGHDVWIGEYAVILPSCSKIGHGAVIAAGAVVNKDIPPYAIVVGNPGRVVRYRFEKDIINELLKSQWWDQDLSEIKKTGDKFFKPYKGKKHHEDQIVERNENVPLTA